MSILQALRTTSFKFQKIFTSLPLDLFKSISFLSKLSPGSCPDLFQTETPVPILPLGQLPSGSCPLHLWIFSLPAHGSLYLQQPTPAVIAQPEWEAHGLLLLWTGSDWPGRPLLRPWRMPPCSRRTLLMVAFPQTQHLWAIQPVEKEKKWQNGYSKI